MVWGAKIAFRLQIAVSATRPEFLHPTRSGREDALRDEPDWAGLLSVVPIELDERDLSAN
jgi:hypothetical protein